MSARKIKGVWRYRIVVKLPDGSKQRISGTPEINTKGAAEKDERAHIERLKYTDEIKPKISAPLFSDFSSRWLDRHVLVAGNRSSTRTQRESHLRVRLAPFFDGLTLDKIDRARISALQAELLIELEPSSAAGVVNTLTLLLRDAQAWGELSAMPDLPKRIKIPKGEKKALTDSQQAALLASCESELERLTVIFALDTGARAGEQLGVQWGDVDFNARRIWIRRQRYAGETRETKTGIVRYVDMTGRLHDSLRDHVIRSEGSKLGDSEFIFSDSFGRPRTYSHLQSLIVKLCGRTKIEPVSWHCLRHTFASRLLNRDVPPHVIQRWLGHTGVGQTMEYAHADTDEGSRYIRSLDA